ncbi:MAG: hypothetical protein C0594_03730, partial [Marinilabiliales bacterium]
KQHIGKAKRRKRTLAFSAMIILLAVFAGFTWWAMNERSKAAEALKQKELAEQKMRENMKLIISADRMNVVYRGIENQISVVASGVSLEDVNASVTNGKLKFKEPGKYILMPGRGNEVVFNTYAKLDSQTKNMGKIIFRVQDIPDPIAKIDGKRGGVISKETLLELGRLEADLENFPFDLRFVVKSFKMKAYKNGFTTEYYTTGAEFSDEQKKVIEELYNGGMIDFTSITAMGPDGKIRPIGSISLKVLDKKHYEEFILEKND